jgi:hypothetical protein
MGKKAKEHRKKVAKRNEALLAAKKKYTKEFQRLWEESIKKKELDANKDQNDTSISRPYNNGQEDMLLSGIK